MYLRFQKCYHRGFQTHIILPYNLIYGGLLDGDHNCNTVKGNESLVENSIFYFLTPLSQDLNASF